MAVSLAGLVPDFAVERARRRATPKGAMVTRAAEKTAEDKDEKKAEAAWKRAVWARDKGKCRICGCRVLKALKLVDTRGECHHVERRENKVTRWDVRNGLLCCNRDHSRFTQGQLHIVATARQLFVASDGKSYINANAKTLRFVA